MRNVWLVGIALIITSIGVWAHDEDNTDDTDHNIINTTQAIVPENPTYYEHIKPLLELHCLACHSEGQISGDIPLTDPDTVEKSASDIAFNASIAYMPPWMPSPQSLPLQHDRSLSTSEIATFVAWSDQGAPLGEPEDYSPPQAPPYHLHEIRPDLTLQLGEPYTPDETAQDDYRCFAFPLQIETTQHITGYEFLPDVTEMAHHGIVYLVSDEAQRGIERRNGEDGRPGWSCYGGIGLSVRSQMLGTWAPGALPVLYPQGTGYRIEPGDSLIVQMHYNLAITRQPDQTMIVLQFADDLTTIAELMTMQLMAPVEIPCPTGIEGVQCARTTAIERLGRLYGMDSQYLPDALLQDCGQTLNDYADNTGENAIGYCDYPIPTALTMFGTFAHMHELGRQFRMELNPDSDQPLILLDIPNWDFHWQDQYLFREPLELTTNDTIRMTCHWDNSRSDDPRYIVWGDGTADEMCFSTVMVLRP